MNRLDQASSRRLSRIRFRDGWTFDMWLLVAGVLILAVLFLAGTITHPPHR